MSDRPTEPDPLQHFVLEVRALRDPDGVPPAARVKQWLKQGLRRFFLRVVTYRPVVDETPASEAGPGAREPAGGEAAERPAKPRRFL